SAGFLKEYERCWRARLGPDIRAGLAFRAVAARLGDGAIDRLMELARVDGIVPLLKQTADFNWHRTATKALLRHAEFRRIVLSSIWSCPRARSPCRTRIPAALPQATTHRSSCSAEAASCGGVTAAASPWRSRS